MPTLPEIFSDFGNDGLATSWREFLGYFVKQFWPGVNTQIEKLYFMRLDYPLLVLPFFLLAVIALFSFWEKPTFKRAAIAALASGLLFYVYFNTWVYWLVVIGLLFLYTVFFARSEKDRLRGFGVFFAVLLLVVIPFAVRYVSFIHAPGSQDFLYRQWVSEGREVGLTALGFAYFLYVFLAAGIWLLYRNIDRKKAVLLLAFVLAMAVVWNIQLVTGYVPAPDHWKRIISPVLFIIFFILAHDAAERFRGRWPARGRMIAAALLILVGLVVSKKIVNAVSLYRGLQPWIVQKYAFPQELADSWQWINDHISGEPKIISSSSMTSQYLAVYTQARPFLAYGILTPMPTTELEERYLVASKLFSVPDDTLRGELGDEEKIPRSCAGEYCFDQQLNFTKNPFNLYGCYFFRKPFNEAVNRNCDIPAEYREAMIERYHGVQADWRTVEADYVYFGPHERQLGRMNFRNDTRFTLIYENPLVEIYRIQKSK